MFNHPPENFSLIISETRKYGLCLTLAHPYLGQLDEKMREAVFGNVGTIIAFEVGIEDTEILEKEFYLEFGRKDLINLDKYRIYLKMAINGKTLKSFSAITLLLSLISNFRKSKIKLALKVFLIQILRKL